MSVRSLAWITLRLASPLYLSTVLLGLLPAALVTLGVGIMAWDKPWRADLLGQGWLNLVADIAGTAIYTGGLPGLPLTLIALLVVAPLVMLVQLIVYSYLVGGILDSLGRS